MHRFELYKDNKDAWNSFNSTSKNGTFLFHRTYMEYHNALFKDFSLLVYDENNSLIALLPANIEEDKLFSHQGLTYGGLVTNTRMTTPKMVHLFESLISFLKENHINSFLYKTIPSIYYDVISQEDQYALFLNKAELVRRDVISVIDYSVTIPFQERRLRSLKKAEKENLIIESPSDFSEFWELLTNVLAERHNVKPTHSLEEITYLSSHFKENINLYTCRKGNEILAGVILYINKHTVHAQYIAASKEGLNIGALDFLFFYLIKKFKEGNKYFSFGISNENNGYYLNEGLISQKEGFGARSVLHDTYLISL